MKKTQRKDAIRNIKKRIVSFLSVCLVVALGLGVLFTTRYTSAGLDKEYSDFFKARNFKNFEMIASLGVSEANLDKIRKVDGVTAAEGIMLADGVVSFDGKNRNAVVSSLTKEVSVPELVDGKLPIGKDECAIGEDFAEAEGLKAGDKVWADARGKAVIPVVAGAPVGDNCAFKAPVIAQYLCLRVRVFGAECAVYFVVGVHNRPWLSLFNGYFKSGQINFTQGAFVNNAVAVHTARFLIVGTEVFKGCAHSP